MLPCRMIRKKCCPLLGKLYMDTPVGNPRELRRSTRSDKLSRKLVCAPSWMLSWPRACTTLASGSGALRRSVFGKGLGLTPIFWTSLTASPSCSRRPRRQGVHRHRVGGRPCLLRRSRRLALRPTATASARWDWKNNIEAPAQNPASDILRGCECEGHNPNIRGAHGK